ncbi:MAG: UDP-glucose 6-dehydrogenase [Candidatus Woesebacteria bacterium GW2011_GWA1_33_30]|uniref:UDP-glucose 6-dehydrogenase n=1 Tax=Candidatus Woesebacteria bacterium GW2011_GWA2_33_28 TaxID=1618561 RepID=A0A0G0CS31_9BACT|nr:MAG: UDP-glucose 6-dehydrogenase [Candidatus Woesebacteria bacterium GW2011_GWA2_33_28]KKP46539.1 MAG: UDP-glucose 6-dehydrogenase [Candidatus Woesebacteria bacterium GW2011_GWA1_33_30]KKP48107.1 MAG: UDP-glucose 6-dehydrogenase [Microgenomates group bacterium GW2011_GWC1_33_32]KKP52169.1 MAG: UDP-glucose 6-dehydrogenase [Candidatus Woesebacteria bacterium GW2011_GWB1_33_38]
MHKVGIIGWGFVGEATGTGFAKSRQNKVFWFDKFKKSPNTFDEVIEKSDYIFICVPTPMFRNYSGMDMSIVEGVLDLIVPKVSGAKKIVIIKSTSLPGTTAKYAKKYPSVNFAMNPEFLTQNKAKEDFLNPARTVIGVKNKELGIRIQELYKTILPKDQKYFITGLTEAEIIKYMSNLMLASKVLLANEFYMLAEDIGANYKEIYPAVQADPRIGTHLSVPGPDGDLGFGGACFPKDILGLLSFATQKKIDMSALSGIWKKNLKIRKVKDWEHMDNAFGRGASLKK